MIKLVAVLWLITSIGFADDSKIKAVVEYTELLYEDSCKEIAEAEWQFVDRPDNKTLLAWETRRLEHGDLTKTEREMMENSTAGKFPDEYLRYKYDVIVKPGDAMMNPRDWQRLVWFSGSAELVRKSIAKTAYSQNYTQKGVDYALSRRSDEKKKREAWINWQKQFKPLLDDFAETLPLVEEASRVNGASGIRKYWETLSVCANCYENAETQWTRILELHRKILRFVGRQLSKKYHVNFDGETVPVHLLGSSRGYDWTTLPIDISKDANSLFELRKNLWKKGLFGIDLYKSASSLSESLLNDRPQEEFWTASSFDRTCPSKLVNICRDGAMRVSSCADASILNYLSAHRDVAKVSFYQISRENTSTLNIVNRYSGLEEGLSEFFAILSASPSWLNQTGLLKMSDEETDEMQKVSLLITALDVLPRLAYYISADLWRINAMEKNITDPKELVDSWWNHRKIYEGIAFENTETPSFLTDDFITANKPYLAKYMGIIVGFQLYEYLMKSTEVRYNRIDAKMINAHFVKIIQNGAASNWMETLKEYLEIYEISADSLLSFFEPLDNFLDEIDDDDDEGDSVFALSDSQEKEIEDLERSVLKQREISITTARTVKTTTWKNQVKNTTPVPANTGKSKDFEEKVSSPMTEKSLKEEDAFTARSAGKIVEENAKNNSSTKTTELERAENGSIDSQSVDYDENFQGNVGTSKAAWCVAAVLVAVIVVCVIVVFGRKRCRKTPQNRRYI